MEQDIVASEKQNLEQRLLAQEGDNNELRSSHSDLEVTQLKTQLEVCGWFYPRVTTYIRPTNPWNFLNLGRNHYVFLDFLIFFLFFFVFFNFVGEFH